MPGTGIPPQPYYEEVTRFAVSTPGTSISIKLTPDELRRMKKFVVIEMIYSLAANGDFVINFNGDSGANYSRDTTTTATSFDPFVNIGIQGLLRLYITNVATMEKIIDSQNMRFLSNAMFDDLFPGAWRNTVNNLEEFDFTATQNFEAPTEVVIYTHD